MRSKTGQPFVGLLQLAGGGGIFLDLNLNGVREAVIYVLAEFVR